MTPAEYRAIFKKVKAAGYAYDIEWSETVKPPTTAEAWAGEAIWVVCCSNFKEQHARGMQERVQRALAAGKSATLVYGKSNKGPAIDALWKGREAYFAHFRLMVDGNAAPNSIISWIGTLPFVGGPILRLHLAKSLGIDCVKPDVHLQRLADHYGTTPDALCRRLAPVVGHRVATVDLVLWRAANLNIIDTRAMEREALERAAQRADIAPPATTQPTKTKRKRRTA